MITTTKTTTPRPRKNLRWLRTRLRSRRRPPPPALCRPSRAAAATRRLPPPRRFPRLRLPGPDEKISTPAMSEAAARDAGPTPRTTRHGAALTSGSSVHAANRPIPPQCGSIRFRLALCTYDQWDVRVVRLTKSRSRKIPTRKRHPSLWAGGANQCDIRTWKNDNAYVARALTRLHGRVMRMILHDGARSLAAPRVQRL